MTRRGIVCHDGAGKVSSGPRDTPDDEPVLWEDEVTWGAVECVYVQLSRGGGEDRMDLGGRRGTWVTAGDLGVTESVDLVSSLQETEKGQQGTPGGTPSRSSQRKRTQRRG